MTTEQQVREAYKAGYRTGVDMHADLFTEEHVEEMMAGELEDYMESVSEGQQT